jgi:2-phospho-L-lactate guanylyltransferase
MTWTALIPLKGSGERKTRLAGRLDEGQRRTLSQKLFSHVASVLNSSAPVSEVMLLSDVRPDNWNGPLIFDEGRGLNIELQAFVRTLGPRPLLIIHADLPLVSAKDIAILLAEAESGCAIAPDRHGNGTNAIALRDAVGFEFSFGPDSFALHRAALQGRVHVVSRLGLGLDIDTPDDLDAAIALGPRA